MAAISDLFAAADQSLFKRVLANELHVLQPLLPDKTNLVIIYAHGTITDNMKTTYVNNSHYIVAALLATQKQSAVIATAIPSVTR